MELARGPGQLSNALLEGEYGNAWDLLDAYLSSFPQEAEEQLRTLFETENHVLTSSQNADAGAFTTYLYEYDQPFCYFGPGYHNGYSILHEMGHYFSCFYSENDLQMDLAETQSQANEWLFTAFLDHYDQNGLLSQTVFYYQLHSSLQTIVMASIIDEFEQSVYLNPPASTEEFEQRMDWVCEGYGGTKTVQTLFADPQRYWRAVVLDNPCYYISYAFSMLVSTNFYGAALEDVSSAYQTYLSLVEAQLEDGTYCAWLQEQGIPTPFEDQLYQNLLSAVS